MATLVVRRARRSAREPAMALSRLKMRLSPLPGAPKCRRTVPGTGCFSLGKESSKGLNTESNNPQRASAMALVEIAMGRHCRDETHDVTQVQGPLGEVKPLRPALVVLHCLQRLQYKESFGSSRWLTMAIATLQAKKKNFCEPPCLNVLPLLL